MECACSPFQEGERRNDVQLLGPIVHKQSSLSNTHFTLGSNAIACPVLLLTLRQIPFTNLGARKYSNGLDSPCGRKHMRKNRVRKREHPKFLTGGTGQNLRAGCLGAFFIFIFFENIFYRNIFSISYFTVMYPYRPAGGRQGACRPAAGRQGLICKF